MRRHSIQIAATAAAFAGTTCNDVSVTAVDPAIIEITPEDPAVQVAHAVTLSARVLSREGRILTGRSITWRSTDAQIATVDASGTVNGIAAGVTHVHATSGDAADSVLLTVEPPDPSIQLQPAALAFTGTRGAANPDAQSAEITNAGGRTLDGLTVSVVYPGGQAGGWVTTSLSGGVAPATLTVGVNISSLAHGTYTATINVSSGVADNSPQSLAVTLELADALPAIGVSATTAAFAANVGGADPDDVRIDVSNTGGRTLDGLAVTVTYPSGQQTGWLTARLAGTAAPTVLTLSAATGALPVGTHAATVRVASSVATNSPVTVAATFVVHDVPPGAPGALAATVVSSSQVNLAWQAAAGTVDEYRIDRRMGTGAWGEIGRVSAAARTYQSTGLAAATAYTWRVTACNAVGCSPPSNEATATTLPNPPATPASIAATTASSSAIDVSWSSVNGTVSEYRLERRAGAGAFALHATLAPATTSYDDDGLTPATSYTYRVQACNAGGCSAFTSEAPAMTYPLPPSVPGTLTLSTISATRIDLAWGASSGAVSGYEVERRTGSGAYALIVTVTGATTFANTGLTPATTYVYHVRACNPGGCSAYGNDATQATLPTPPTAPVLTAQTFDSSSIDLNWSGATGTITEYRLERVSPDAAVVAVLSGLITSHRDIGLTAETEHAYRVQACNTGGCSPYSNEASAFTLP